MKIQSLVILPTCAHCGKIRSPNYQRRHPLAPNQIPKVRFCRNCARKETSSEGSDDDNKKSWRRHRRRHLRPLGRETWAEYLGLTDKSYHPIVHTSRRRPSQKPIRPLGTRKLSKSSNGKHHKKKDTPTTSREAILNSAVEQKISPTSVRIVRHTTNANGSSQARSGGTPRASSRKRSAEKKAQDIPSTRSARSSRRRLPSPKPIRKVRRTTYVYGSKPSQAGSLSRSSADANLIEKRVEELSIHNDESGPGRSFKNGEGHDTKRENGRPSIRHLESLLVEPGTPQSTHLHHYFDRGRAPYANSGHVDDIKGFSYRREALAVEGLHRSRTGSVRLIRVGGELDSLLSSSSSAQTSPGGTELASRPPSRITRVLKAQSDRLRSRPQSPRNGPPASEFRLGSRPPSRSVRVFRADSGGLRSRPQSPRNDPPASEFGQGSRPSSQVFRAIRVPSGLRSSPQSSTDNRAPSELDRESRSPARSVRVLRVNSDGFSSHPQPATNDRAPTELEQESRPPSRSVRAHPDDFQSHSHSSTGDQSPSKSRQQSQPPSRSIRVPRVQPDVRHLRPQSSVVNETVSNSGWSLLAQSEKSVRAGPDGTYSRPTSAQAIQMSTESFGSRPLSQSFRVLHVQPDVYPQRMQSPTQFYESRPPSRSDGIGRVSQDSSRLRSNSRDLRTRPGAARELDEPRPRSSFRRIYNEVEDLTGDENASPDWHPIRPKPRSPSPICGGNSGEGVKRPIIRRQRTRYHGSESSGDSISIRKLNPTFMP